MSVAGESESLGAEGYWRRNLVERGVEKDNLRCTGGEERDGEAAAIGICGDERDCARAEPVGARYCRAVGVKNG